MELGRIGIWSAPLRRGDLETARRAAAEVEALGFRALWIPGGEEGMGTRVEGLLEPTHDLVIAIGIVNIWFHAADEVAELYRWSRTAHPDRLLIGVGVGHAPLVDRAAPGRYRRPLASLAAYLDQLDSAPDPVPADRRFVGAFGPRMLGLARDRAMGAHPYLVTPEHTRWARHILGPQALLAPEQHVVLERDAARARAVAREYLATCWNLPNYLANFRRMGFGDADFHDGGSDRLVDALVAWGAAETVLKRVEAHLAAGADHVCVQVLQAGRQGVPLSGWRALAAALADTSPGALRSPTRSVQSPSNPPPR